MDKLTDLYVHNNDISKLDVSNNLAMEYLRVYNNPKLQCVKIKEIQQVTFAWRIEKDDNQVVSTKCF